MTSTDKNIDLVINKLTQEQYNILDQQGQLSDDELYFITDDKSVDEKLSDYTKTNDFSMKFEDSILTLSVGTRPLTATISMSDTKVTQTVSETNDTYPILACAVANQSSTTTDTAVFGSGIKLNPSTSTIIASNFSGTAEKANQDVNGNAITSTYATNASPTFSGTPTAPTASTSTNTNQLATTGYVKSLIWKGTQAQYDAIETKDANVIYYILES